MTHNVDLLRRAYEAFARGDLDGAMELFADDIRWEGPRTEGLPDSGAFHGKDEVAWMFKHLSDVYGDEVRVVPDEFVEQDQTVVVLGHLQAAPRGVELKVPWVHIWRFDHETAIRVQTLTDTALVKEALASAY